MKIDVFKHGDSSLWLALGPFMADRSVHAELGGPIYSVVGMTWLVAQDSRGQVLGFASLREAKSVTHYDYGYVVPDHRKRGVFSRLTKERDKIARELGHQLRTVVRSDRCKHYLERGWTVTSRRGSWVHISKGEP